MQNKSFSGDRKLAHRVEDAAKISGLSRSTIFLHIREGRLKSVKVGGARLIHDTELRHFLKIEERV